MGNKLINHFQKITNLSVNEVNVLTESLVIKEYPKGSFLIKEGQLGIDTYFVLTKKENVANMGLITFCR